MKLSNVRGIQTFSFGNIGTEKGSKKRENNSSAVSSGNRRALSSTSLNSVDYNEMRKTKVITHAVANNRKIKGVERGNESDGRPFK